MDLQFHKEDFDSQLFGKPVYKMSFSQHITKNALEDILKKVSSGFIFCFFSFSNKNINILNSYDFHFISIRSTYKLQKNPTVSFALSPEYMIVKNSDYKNKISEKDIFSLADDFRITSRYYKDHNIRKDTSLKIYLEWIKNSLYNGYADESFLVIYKKKTLVGLLTQKIKKEGGYIDLLVVDPKHQRKKLASSLIMRCVEDLIEKKIKDIYIITEGENIPANRLYQKHNFLIDNMQLVFHKYINA